MSQCRKVRVILPNVLRRAVGMDEAMIWPEVVRSAVKTGADREVVQVFPSHSAVPTSVWQRLVAGAERELALAGATYEWLWYAVPSLNRVLRDKAQSGVRIRVVLSDPADPLIRADEQATAVPMALSTRIEQTRHLLEPLRDVVAVRQSAMGYGRGVIRSDDTATLHVWVHGALGTELPVLLLHRHQDGGLFDRMAVQHVDALFEAGRPVWG